MTNEKKALKKQKLRNAEYYDLQSFFDTLYENSKNKQVFTDLMEIIQSEENIKLAYRNIKKNTGSRTPGFDGKNISDIAKLSEGTFIRYIQKSLEWYTPNKVRRVEIPKDNGKTRPLGIPTIRDRIIQQCILQVLEPICEAKFNKNSFGFRPNRSCEHAIAGVHMKMQQHYLHYVVDIDIKSFFDNVDHGKLLKQMWTLGIRDKKLFCIISAMLKAEVAGIGFPEKGTPQGGIISPLLSNIVLNELDWWVSSQWETLPTRHKYSYSHNYRALKKSNLKECFIVRYADDFKIFCRTRSDAIKMFESTKLWLKERLGLEISLEKSKIVNLKRHYSDFLGFKLKVHKNGKRYNGETRYTVKSHISDKALKKIKQKATKAIKEIQAIGNKNAEHQAAMRYNSFVIGVHNYYRIATHVSKDFNKIAFNVNKNLKNRLNDRLKKVGTISSEYIKTHYGGSKEMRFLVSAPIIPIGYIRTKPPKSAKLSINKYTVDGRSEIHKNLEHINTEILGYLMRNAIKGQSIEYNDNRLSLYCAQRGKCAVTHDFLSVEQIHCHHKTPVQLGGNDKYNNLIILHISVHRLIHATVNETIQKLLSEINPDKKALCKINELRLLCNLQPLS